MPPELDEVYLQSMGLGLVLLTLSWVVQMAEGVPEEDFESGYRGVLAKGAWLIEGPVVDGNCGGGAAESRLALCFFGGGRLQTRETFGVHGGEMLHFWLRAGNFLSRCAPVEEEGQVLILEGSADGGAQWHEIRRFDFLGWGENWVHCEEAIPKKFIGNTMIRFHFKGTGNHFFKLDEIKMVKGDNALDHTKDEVEGEKYIVNGSIDQIGAEATEYVAYVT